MNKKILFMSAITLSALTFAQVGINTETPSATLDIVSSGSTNTTKALEINNSAATEMVTVLDNGNVGIGTTTPTQKLEINGSIAFTNSFLGGLRFFNLAPLDKVIRLGLNMPNHYGESDNSRAGGFISFDTRISQVPVGLWAKNENSTSEVLALSITNQGRVGIGTVNFPLTESLHVNGAIIVGQAATANTCTKAGQIYWNGTNFMGCTSASGAGVPLN